MERQNVLSSSKKFENVIYVFQHFQVATASKKHLKSQLQVILCYFQQNCH